MCYLLGLQPLYRSSCVVEDSGLEVADPMPHMHCMAASRIKLVRSCCASHLITCRHPRCAQQVTGTPGFRAPEVMDIGWSKAADTYAYGVIAWQLLTGEKPIVYDREWRMHVPNPDLLRVDRTGGVEEVPKPLADLVWDCGSYNAKDRPSMREVGVGMSTNGCFLWARVQEVCYWIYVPSTDRFVSNRRVHGQVAMWRIT